MLCALLDQHPALACTDPFELLPTIQEGDRPFWRHSRYWPHDPWGWVASRMPGESRCFTSLKLFHVQALGISMTEALRALERLDYHRFLLLRRANEMLALVSSKIAWRTNRWHVERGHGEEGRGLESMRVALDPRSIANGGFQGSLLAYLEHQDMLYDNARRQLAGRELLDLTYEDDILPDPLIGFEKAREFLGLRPHPVGVTLARSNPFPLQETLENYGQVRDYLAGSPYSWMVP